ncbi:30S ribosomal protein S4 [Nannocystis sp. ILAH1]|jgi:small subunit ribosomal protein S4|uniref:30S ribosomal protein S4 n=1 Tax=unclassified Nannocystis TaxID=2627009 RepID=UPI00226EBE9B|nr:MULTISPECIES: 30S ribosomal protein S4 [unclassified Nannocystis]MCY0990028.1 30S ribosomal protein S4 [Nannocystis sp. ILAH1]MCY1066810.1 30S ribosomal protein S4 [Nannocystis sp. RBIL2]
MARYIGPVCRLCRREDAKLFLKGDRCFTDKCGYERRQYPPGQHGQGRKKRPSDYGQQLREKQKVKRIYGLLEKQFRGYYYRASRMKGVTGENLLALLERRLDNVTLRCGFSSSHAEARQLVRHGHFLVNGKRINIPSYQVRAGDIVEVRDNSKKIKRIVDAIGQVDRVPRPAWIDLDKENMRGKITALPSRSDISADIDEQLIVELYSK